MEKEESELETFKEEFCKLREKFALPSFEELNQDFSIEKLCDVETDYLVREIRKFISDKLYNYLRFVESILQPVNSPMFVFSLLKSLGVEEKNKLKDIYAKLSRLEIDLIEVDVSYSEEKEVAFIQKAFVIWQGIKKDVLDISEVAKRNWENKAEFNGKNYFS